MSPAKILNVYCLWNTKKVLSMCSHCVAEKLQSHMLAPVSFSLQGIACFTPTVHLGNMIHASLLTVSSGLTPFRPTNTGSKQWLNDFEIPSKNFQYFCFFWCFLIFYFNTDLTLYPASRIVYFWLLQTILQSTLFVCWFWCFCKNNNDITGWRNDLSIWYFFCTEHQKEAKRTNNRGLSVW